MPFRWIQKQPRPPVDGKAPFAFLDPGPLVDGDLELLPPHRGLIDSVLLACNHPKSVEEAPSLQNTTRRQLIDFLDACPGGRQRAEPTIGMAPTYHFWMRSSLSRQLPIVGGLGLRIANQYEIVMYYGHFGYHVYPPARGHRYAERAVRLLLPLAARHGIDPIWITCNPDNTASRRTCENLGGKLVEIVPVPVENPLHQRGEKEKCRYRIETTAGNIPA
jgi:predicted acetyltransferase